MNYELFAQIVLFISFCGLLGIIAKKIPVLKEVDTISLPKKESPISKIKIKFNNLSELNPVKLTSLNAFAQKVLSKIRILSLKIDNKISNWLENLRQKRIKETKNIKKFENKIQKDNTQKNDYWDEIKEAKNNKDFSI